jgi:mRNA-degrading endonuclease toxin of MazEF toxin-antitoxin module
MQNTAMGVAMKEAMANAQSRNEQNSASDTAISATITEAHISERALLRDKYISKTDALDKVKQIFLIPKMECLTTKMVADYFEVSPDVIQKCYQRNNEEIESDGVGIKNVDDFRVGLGVQGIKSSAKGGGVEFDIGNGMVVIIPYGWGTKTFSKRAVLRIAMLLRDSEIAKAVRTQLLDIYEAQEAVLVQNVMRYPRGSVWHWKKGADLASGRYVVVISSKLGTGDKFADVIALHITKTSRGWDSETPIIVTNGVQSYVQGETIHTIPINELDGYYGDISEEMLIEIKNKLLIKLELTKENMGELAAIVRVQRRYKAKRLEQLTTTCGKGIG